MTLPTLILDVDVFVLFYIDIPQDINTSALVIIPPLPGGSFTWQTCSSAPLTSLQPKEFINVSFCVALQRQIPPLFVQLKMFHFTFLYKGWFCWLWDPKLTVFLPFNPLMIVFRFSGLHWERLPITCHLSVSFIQCIFPHPFSTHLYLTEVFKIVFNILLLTVWLWYACVSLTGMRFVSNFISHRGVLSVVKKFSPIISWNSSQA